MALVAEALFESLQQRAATGKGNATIHDVASQLWRGAVEGVLDRLDDVADRFAERLAHLLGAERDRLRQAGDEVAAADLRAHLLGQWRGRARLELHFLGGMGADRKLVLVFAVGDDRLVELVAADPDRLRDNDAAERDHRHLGGAATDVGDHRAGRLGYW